MNTAKQRKLSIVISAVYLAAISCVILFKFPFKAELGSTRAIQLIPFYVSEIKNYSFFWSNIWYNILFFVPIGISVYLIQPHWRFTQKIIPIAMLSLLFEVVQYVFSLGVSDTTDLLTNTAGGILGIAVYHIMKIMFKEKTQRIINAISSTFVIIMLILFYLAYKFMIR